MASSKAKGLGSSLSIQELAKQPMLGIPERYVRLDNEPSSILSEDATSLQMIPIVDMQQLLRDDATDFKLEKLHAACKEWGIFQLVNHGVSSLLVEKLKYEIEEFYMLPSEEKMRFKIQPGDVEGETLESYISELQKLAMTLFGLMEKALKINKGEIEEMFDDGTQSVRMTYYPPCPQPEMVMGLTPHSDATGITILLQVNGVEGFQIKKDGIWIPVNFLPDAFVVNVGDILEGFSSLDDWEDTEGIVEYMLSSSEGEDSDGEVMLNPLTDFDLPTAREQSLATNDTLTVTAHRLAMIRRGRRKSSIIHHNIAYAYNIHTKTTNTISIQQQTLAAYNRSGLNPSIKHCTRSLIRPATQQEQATTSAMTTPKGSALLCSATDQHAFALKQDL
ncbi:hypothetical protein TEA_001349 [Camellia sinensis var. sinensis]|uniref:Fe2OG dioxygenase domain-containing protein n=1 Tax=Camellia sinensis var. sinensis TaxID=542762 RepID=A0A4S4DGJ1_CAMSN|nr:hypothetical protein TEA_001349 [Camellia sinensis var. sinensis]